MVKSKVVKQIIREFWLQFIVSLLWSLYVILSQKIKPERMFITATQSFITSFFFISWFTGQINRIKKQQKIESEFGDVKNDLQKIVLKFKEVEKDLSGYITGAEEPLLLHAYCLFKMDVVLIFIKNKSRYPVYDVTVKWWVISGVEPLEGEEGSKSFPAVFPNTGDQNEYYIGIRNHNTKDIKISLLIDTRNGLFEYKIYGTNSGLGIWHFASKVSGKFGFKFDIPEKFPNYEINKEKSLFAWENLPDEDWYWHMDLVEKSNNLNS